MNKFKRRPLFLNSPPQFLCDIPAKLKVKFLWQHPWLFKNSEPLKVQSLDYQGLLANSLRVKQTLAHGDIQHQFISDFGVLNIARATSFEQSLLFQSVSSWNLKELAALTIFDQFDRPHRTTIKGQFQSAKDVNFWIPFIQKIKKNLSRQNLYPSRLELAHTHPSLQGIVRNQRPGKEWIICHPLSQLDLKLGAKLSDFFQCSLKLKAITWSDIVFEKIYDRCHT